MLASFLDDAGCMMESFVEDKISVSFFENTNLDDVPVGEEIRGRGGNKSIVKVGKMENCCPARNWLENSNSSIDCQTFDAVCLFRICWRGLGSFELMDLSNVQVVCKFQLNVLKLCKICNLLLPGIIVERALRFAFKTTCIPPTVALVRSERFTDSTGQLQTRSLTPAAIGLSP